MRAGGPRPGPPSDAGFLAPGVAGVLCRPTGLAAAQRRIRQLPVTATAVKGISCDLQKASE